MTKQKQIFLVHMICLIFQFLSRFYYEYAFLTTETKMTHQKSTKILKICIKYFDKLQLFITPLLQTFVICFEQEFL